MKNGIIIDGKVYELVKSDDFNCCKNCDLREDCEISKVKGPCRSFENHEDKHFKLRNEKAMAEAQIISMSKAMANHYGITPTPVEVKEEPKQETKKTQPTEAPKWVQRSLFD